MIDCDKLKMEISNYLDGELSISQRRDLEDHLSNCSNCEELIRQVRIIQQSLRQLPNVKSSPDFEQRLREQIFSQPEKFNIIPPPLQNWKIPAMGSALILATVGLFLVFDNTANQEQQLIDGQVKKYTPAATQISGGYTVTQPGQSASNLPRSENSTLIQDSLNSDSSNIAREGLKLVGD